MGLELRRELRREQRLEKARLKEPPFEEVAAYLEKLYDEWPWAFHKYELTRLIQKTYGDRLAPDRPFDLAIRYLDGATTKKAIKKAGAKITLLIESKPWHELFRTLIGGGRGTLGKNALPQWAMPALNIPSGSRIVLCGRKPEHIWARLFHECEQAADTLRCIPKCNGIGILLCLKDNKNAWVDFAHIRGYLMHARGTRPETEKCVELLEKLILLKLVEKKQHWLYKDPDHTQFKLSKLAIDSFSQLEKLIDTGHFLTDCPAWRSLLQPNKAPR